MPRPRKPRRPDAEAKPDAKPKPPYTEARSVSYALWLLSRRAYTSAEVAAKLRAKDAAPEVVERVTARLQELGYLNDERYAEHYAESRARKKGPLALRRELLHKGVLESTVETTLAAHSPEDQLAHAKALLARQAWRFQRGDERKDRARAYAFLARRGFTPDVLREALATPNAQDPADEDPTDEEPHEDRDETPETPPGEL